MDLESISRHLAALGDPTPLDILAIAAEDFGALKVTFEEGLEEAIYTSL
jgi:hypothetical protein